MKISLHRTTRRIQYALLLSFLLGVQSVLNSASFAQIATDAVSGTASTAATISWTHTVGSGSNSILIVGVSNRRSNRTVIGVTYAGSSLTRIGFQNSGANTSRLEMWYLLAPPPGAASIVVVLTASADVVCGAVSFSGVDQSAPMGTFSSASGTGQTASVPVSSALGEVVVDVVAAPGTALSLAPGIGQVTHWNSSTGTGGNDVRGAGSSLPGAVSVTPAWSLGVATDWAHGAISLKPAPYPNLTLTLGQDNNNPPPGTTVTYTLTYANAGSAQAGNTSIAISAPANTTFATDGVALNGVPKSDLADLDEVTRTGSTITVNLGTVPGGTVGTVTYKVLVQ